MEFNINPVAFNLFGLDVRWYGIIIALGMLLASLIIQKLAKQEKMNVDQVLDLLLYTIIIGIIGARVYYVIFQWPYYKGDFLKMINIREGGLAIYGGILAGALFVILYTKRKRMEYLPLLDIFAPALVLAQGIGRWGNFVNQEAYGYPTDLPWGIIIDGQKVHPTFLYESLGDILIFFLLMYYLPKRKNKGEVFYLYMISYGLLRFFVEGLRTDSLYIGSIRVSQLVSLLLFVIGVSAFIYGRKKNKMK